MALKHKEAFGIFGDSPDTFEVKRIATDGALSPQAAVSYKDGVVWAGRQGIYLWDGTDAINLLADTNQNFYTNLIKTVPSSNLRAWGTVKRDYFFVTFTDVGSVTLTMEVTGDRPAEKTRDNFTIAVHIPSRATFWVSNLPFRGTVEAPHSTKDLWWYVTNQQENVIFNDSFEFNTTGWATAGSNSISRDTTHSFCGGNALKTTLHSAGDGVLTTAQTGTMGFSVGDSVSASIRVWCDLDSVASLKINLLELNGIGIFLTGSTGNTYLLKQGWNTLTTGPYTLTQATVAQLKLNVQLTTDITSTANVWFDCAELYNLTDSYYTWYINDWFPLLDGSTENGVDEHQYERETLGPFLYVETGGLDNGDPTLKKRWRDILLHYISWPGTISVAVGRGLSETTPLVALTTPLATATDWIPKKLRFMQQSQILRFAIMQTNRNHQEARLGPAEVGFKPRRRGVV